MNYDIKQGVTASMLSSWLACPERARLSYGEKLAAGEERLSLPLDFGSVLHENLDRCYTDFRLHENTPLDTWQTHLHAAYDETYKEMIESMALSTQTDHLYNVYGMVEPVLKRYHEEWQSDLQRNWVSLEQEFDVDYDVKFGPYSGTNLPLRGKMDGLFRNAQSGRLWLFETKTKALIDDEAIVDRLAFDLQVGLYMLAAEYLYAEQPVGVLYNLVRRPQLRKSVKESVDSFHQRIASDIADRPEWYYLRYEVRMVESEIHRFRREFDQIMGTFVQWANGDFNYRNGISCAGNGYKCQFLKFCSTGDLTGFSPRPKLFPELKLTAI